MRGRVKAQFLGAAPVGHPGGAVVPVASKPVVILVILTVVTNCFHTQKYSWINFLSSRNCYFLRFLVTEEGDLSRYVRTQTKQAAKT